MSLTIFSPSAEVRSPNDRPLIVDLDGTLIRTDSLIECFFLCVSTCPIQVLLALLSLFQGKAALKARLAALARLDVARLPINPQVLDFITTEKIRGRRIFLVSAAHRSIVAEFVRMIELFDGFFASDDRRNLSGDAKAAALCEAFGEGGFDYVGNSEVDVAVWTKAGAVLVADAAPGLQRRIIERWPAARVLSERRLRVRTYFRAIRVHQWAKNILLLVPALAAHHTSPADLGLCALAFLSFSLCASSVYVSNDLIDLSRDRAHPTKRHRPFAAGAIPLLHGIALAPALLLAGVFCGAAAGLRFLVLLLAYYAATLAYSLALKRKMLLDVVTLATLYGLRLYAGAAAVQVAFSAWLGTFALFLFTCLALVKRCAELTERAATGAGDPPGRDYRTADLPALLAMAAGSGMTAVLVVALYADSAAVRALYHDPNRLYLICVVLLYWFGRILMLTQRNQMHEDPVIFAATDRVSLACGAACVGIVPASL